MVPSPLIEQTKTFEFKFQKSRKSPHCELCFSRLVLLKCLGFDSHSSTSSVILIPLQAVTSGPGRLFSHPKNNILHYVQIIGEI